MSTNDININQYQINGHYIVHFIDKKLPNFMFADKFWLFIFNNSVFMRRYISIYLCTLNHFPYPNFWWILQLFKACFKLWYHWGHLSIWIAKSNKLNWFMCASLPNRPTLDRLKYVVECWKLVKRTGKTAKKKILSIILDVIEVSFKYKTLGWDLRVKGWEKFSYWFFYQNKQPNLNILK